MKYDGKPKRIVSCYDWSLHQEADWLDPRETLAHNLCKVVDWAINYVLDEMSIDFDLMDNTLKIGCFEDRHFVKIKIPTVTKEELEAYDGDNGYERIYPTIDIGPMVREQNKDKATLDLK